MRNIRERLAQAIDDNGGYDKFPLSYNVGLYHVDYRLSSLEKIIKRDHDPDFEFFVYQDDQRMYDLVFQDAEESVRWSLDEGSECYREYPLSVMTRYGITTAKGDCSFDAKYGLYGRGGKHLCVEEFDGKDLPRHLADILRNPEESSYYSFTNQWCRRLLAAMEVWDEEFTQQRAAEAVQDSAAWHLYSWNEGNLKQAQQLALMP